MDVALQRIAEWEKREDPNITLILSQLNLTVLPNLPKDLKQLHCYNNQLTVLPDLPQTLTGLYCNNNQLTVLPNLPQTLTELYCYNNKLVELPVLPQTLTRLDCYNNKLVELPVLPQTLTNLYCEYNELVTLPDLPQTLTRLYCKNNLFTTLPDIPPAVCTDIHEYLLKQRNTTQPIDVTIYNSKIQLALANKELCPILYEALQEDDLVLTTCLHVFSKSGFTEWRKRTLECPMCRQMCWNVTPE